MIIIIYLSYIFTYISILIHAEKQIPANFFLINTSNYYSAKTKGIILLVITLILVIFLLISIIKTVITNPGYFKEPSFLECKVASIQSENILHFKEIGSQNSSGSNKPKTRNEENDNEKNDSKDYFLEKEILTSSQNRDLNENKNNKTNKTEVNINDKYDSDKDINNNNKFDNLLDIMKNYSPKKNDESENFEKGEIKNKNNTNNINNNDNNDNSLLEDLKKENSNSNQYENSKITIYDFKNIIKKTPINEIEYFSTRKEIDAFYDQRKADINYDQNSIKKSNEEILEKNKISIMMCKENCEKNKEPFKFDLSFLYKKTDITKINQCGTCQRMKIERSHHCKLCQRCVLKMDHHCPWLANCIGFFNYKYFCLVHFYGTISTSIIFFTYWETVINTHLNYNSTILECWFVTSVYVMNISLLIFLSWLLYVNAKLVYNGETIIEQSDRERFPSTKNFNIYDMGWKRNFTNLFGDRWYVWLLPGFPNLKGEGMFYETKKKFYFEKEDLIISDSESL
jgi:hypothetical protein